MDTTKATTGERLSEKLAENGMSKRELSAESGVSYKTVCRIANGHRLGNLDTWMRFAEALDCDLDDIV